MDTKRFQQLRDILCKELFVGLPQSKDMGDKLGVVAMICYLTHAFKQKKPGMTHYETIRLCTKDVVTDDEQIERLAIVCEWFSDGCVKFPDLGVKAKDMPAQIKNYIQNLIPF